MMLVWSKSALKDKDLHGQTHHSPHCCVVLRALSKNQPFPRLHVSTYGTTLLLVSQCCNVKHWWTPMCMILHGFNSSHIPIPISIPINKIWNGKGSGYKATVATCLHAVCAAQALPSCWSARLCLVVVALLVSLPLVIVVIMFERVVACCDTSRPVHLHRHTHVHT